MPQMLIITVKYVFIVRLFRNRWNRSIFRFTPSTLTLLTCLADYLAFTGNKPYWFIWSPSILYNYIFTINDVVIESYNSWQLMNYNYLAICLCQFFNFNFNRMTYYSYPILYYYFSTVLQLLVTFSSVFTLNCFGVESGNTLFLLVEFLCTGDRQHGCR